MTSMSACLGNYLARESELSCCIRLIKLIIKFNSETNQFRNINLIIRPLSESEVDLVVKESPSHVYYLVNGVSTELSPCVSLHSRSKYYHIDVLRHYLLVE